MKLFFQRTLSFVLVLYCTTVAGQTNTPTQVSIPELVFKNPVLESGTAGQDGASYRFEDVATNIDAIVKITRRSSSAVTLATLDATSSGWTKALQPQLGISGNVPSGQTWWMEFEMRFVEGGSTKKKKINSFFVTALDVDGDGAYIRETVQMDKVNTVSSSFFSFLSQDAALSLPTLPTDDLTSYNLEGTDKKVVGPIQNFGNIDTSATSVMTTFSYEDKDVVKFLLGGKSSGGISNAGVRLYSLWFKTFNLQQTALPVKLTSFSTFLEKKDVVISWSSAAEENFSHYVVEKSLDGENFTELAYVFAAGGLNEGRSYQYKDASVSTSSGILFYRLRMVDNNNQVSYSSIKAIRPPKSEAAPEILVYPNPVKEAFSLTLPGSWQRKEISVELVSASGVRIRLFRIKNASQTEEISLGSIPRGNYLIVVHCEDQTAQKKIFKD